MGVFVDVFIYSGWAQYHEPPLLYAAIFKAVHEKQKTIWSNCQHVSNTVSNIMSFSTPVLVSEILIYIVQSLCCHVRLLVILHTHCYIICQSHKINEQQVPSQWTGIRFTQRLALHKYLLHLLLVTNCQNRDLSGD